MRQLLVPMVFSLALFFSPGKIFAQDLVESGIELVFVPGGCFLMGDVLGEGFADELPVHQVCLDDFFIGKYEVTQWQWKSVMDGANPSRFKKGDDFPVERVSWEDVQLFIKRLNSMTGKVFRLPTEAEWEFACRSGGKPQRYCGDDNLVSVAHYRGNSGYSTQPVGSQKPNGIGAYDMSGNVWEWVQDNYLKSYYEKSPVDNPQGPARGLFRVTRGGSWDYDPKFNRSSVRSRAWPDNGFFSLGFRLAFDLLKEKPPRPFPDGETARMLTPPDSR